MIERLKAVDAEPRYTEYPEAGHDSWTETYHNAEVYKWMFSQRLRAKPIESPTK
jgi:predicted peptidase